MRNPTILPAVFSVFLISCHSSSTNGGGNGALSSGGSSSTSQYGGSRSSVGQASAGGSGGLTTMSTGGSQGKASSSTSASGGQGAAADAAVGGKGGTTDATSLGGGSSFDAGIPARDAAKPDRGGEGGAGGGGTGTGGSAVDGGSATPVNELPGSACTRSFTAPAASALKSNPKMPDPFTFLDGTKVKSKEDWICRQKEIAVLAQVFIYGPKPPKPETLDASYSSGTLTLDMANAGQKWKLTVPIKTPSGSGPFPALFDIDAGAPTGVASIGTGLSWLTSKVAAAGSGRGASGEFYTFYPDYKKTGSLMAWAWVASRIVDGLKATTGHNIDTTKLYGLGCSRNGKTAALMALFDQRIAMVAMQSPGSGMTSGWRPAQAQTSSVQTASEIYGETTWMGDDFGQFGKAVDKLPIDQHEVLALAWPRPILVREGTNDSWNCPVCVYTTLKYTNLIYEALGSSDAIGFTHYSGGHCESGGTAWTTTYNAFLKRYILPADGTTSTANMFDEKFTYDKTKWQDGELTPIP